MSVATVDASTGLLQATAPGTVVSRHHKQGSLLCACYVAVQHEHLVLSRCLYMFAKAIGEADKLITTHSLVFLVINLSVQKASESSRLSRWYVALNCQLIRRRSACDNWPYAGCLRHLKYFAVHAVKGCNVAQALKHTQMIKSPLSHPPSQTHHSGHVIRQSIFSFHCFLLLISLLFTPLRLSCPWMFSVQVITATAHSSIGGGPVSMATADVAVVTPTTMRLSLDDAKLALGHELSVFPISATEVGGYPVSSHRLHSLIIRKSDGARWHKICLTTQLRQSPRIARDLHCLFMLFYHKCYVASVSKYFPPILGV